MKKASLNTALLAAAVGWRSSSTVARPARHPGRTRSTPSPRSSPDTSRPRSRLAPSSRRRSIDLSNVNECIIYADNSAGGSTRALNADCMADDGTTIVYRASASLTTTTRGAVLWGNSVSAAALPAVTTIVPGGTCKKMQFTLAAAGAAAGTLAVDCR
jgi:hypothetical protein